MFLGYPRPQDFRSLDAARPADGMIKALDSLRIPDSIFYLKFIRPLSRRMRSGYFTRFQKNLLGAYIEATGIDFDTISRLKLYDHLSKLFRNKNLDPAFFDRTLYLPNNLLYKTDFATMTHSIEARVPFLDKKVFAFSNSISSNLKLSDKIGKKIVKEYLAQNLPPKLIFRKKEGFSVPLRLYKSEYFEADIRASVSFISDVFDDYGLDGRVFRRLSRDEKFLLMFREKFPDLLFAAVSFHKSVSRIL